MNLKNFSLLALVAAFAIAFAGCAQDSTDTTDDNPAMQEQVAKGEGASAAAEATQSTTEPKTAAAGTKVALTADPSGALKYTTTELDADAGNIAIAFTNASSTPHNVTVSDESDKELGATKDVTDGHGVLALKDVKAGTYTFFCSVPGHEQAGMKGTLTVK